MGEYRNSDFAWSPAFFEMVGPKPPDNFVSNGATKAPDKLFGTNLALAAHWHDFGYSEEYRRLRDLHSEFSEQDLAFLNELWEYDFGIRNEKFRERRDEEFLTNLQTCGAWKWVALIYFFRVRLWGHFAFAYDFGCKPKRTCRFWFNLFLGRYVTW